MEDPAAVELAGDGAVVVASAYTGARIWPVSEAPFGAVELQTSDAPGGSSGCGRRPSAA